MPRSARIADPPREGIVIGHVLRIEGKLFVCSNNAAWLRDFYAELPDAK